MKEQIQFTQEINNNKKLNKYSFRRFVVTAGAFVLSAGGVLAACGSSSTAQETFTMNAKQAGQGTQKCSPGEAVYPLHPLGPLDVNDSLSKMTNYIDTVLRVAGGFKNYTFHYDNNQGVFTNTYNTSSSAPVKSLFDLKFTPSATSKLPAINLSVDTGLYNYHIDNILSCYKNGEQYTTVYDQAIINAYNAANKIFKQ